MEILSLIISSILNVVVLIYMCEKIIDKKVCYFSKKYMFIVLLLTIYWSVSYTITHNIFRILISFLLLVVSCLALFNEKINKAVIASFISLIIMLISEILYAIMIVLFFKIDMLTIKQNLFGNFASNICIMIISVLLICLVCYKKKINNLIEKISLKSKNSNLYVFLIAFSTVLMLIYCIYFETDLLVGLIFGIIIVIVYVIFTINLIKEKINNYQLQEDNQNMVLSLKEYEKMYAFQRMKNHEYKNDLSILRGMIDKKNKKALQYIDEIIDLKKENKSNWMELLKRIPEGGLRGILYYKFLKMEELKINIDFTTTKNYSLTTYYNLSDDIKTKTCKLIGIYLDNAIQAVKDISQKNIYINIDENKEYFIFKIGNKFSNKLELDKISENGYTTKGNGHGYGLSIAKTIIETEPKIENKTSVIKDKFIQELKIQK